jgi:protein-S-isoprenylcysteine O-methyltransferase Ste14
MTPPDNDDLWRNRFIIVNLVRIGATAVVMLALAIWYTNLLVPGGSIVIGLPLALAGVVVSFWGPKWLSRHWKRQDGR